MFNGLCLEDWGGSTTSSSPEQEVGAWALQRSSCARTLTPATTEGWYERAGLPFKDQPYHLSLINTMPLECWRTDDFDDVGWWGSLWSFGWLVVFNLASIGYLLFLGWNMTASSNAAVLVRRRAISRSADAIICNLGYWLPVALLNLVVVLPLEEAACKWRVLTCRKLATWTPLTWDDHGDGQANWIALLQLLLGAQGVSSMLLWCSLNSCGLFARRALPVAAAAVATEAQPVAGAESGGAAARAELLEEDDGAPADNAALKQEVLHYIRRGVHLTCCEVEQAIRLILSLRIEKRVRSSPKKPMQLGN